MGLPGSQFNIKMTSHQHRKSHCGDKTILRPSYLHNGISYTGKMTSQYWIRAQLILPITGTWVLFIYGQWEMTLQMLYLLSLAETLISHNRDWVLRAVQYEILFYQYRKVSNIIRTLVGDEIVDHSDVVGASPAGAAPTTSSFST